MVTDAEALVEAAQNPLIPCRHGCGDTFVRAGGVLTKHENLHCELRGGSESAAAAAPAADSEVRDPGNKVVSTGFELTDELAGEMRETGLFSDEQLEALREAAPELPNWPRSRYEVLADFTPELAFIAHQLVTSYIGQQAIERRPEGTMPDRAPYLDRLEDYDPTDPSQFYTHVDGTLWRWDGKRGVGEDGTRFPYGERHPVIVVDHVEVDGALVPRPDAVTAAIRLGYDWFHHGYGCWVGAGGATYRRVDPRASARMRAAQEQLGGGTATALALAATT
jgi:hypothetical protein